MPVRQPSVGAATGRGGQEIPLIPYPRHLTVRAAPCRLSPGQLLHLPADATPLVRTRGRIISEALTGLGIRTQLSASNALRGCQALLSSAPQVGKRWEPLIKTLRGLATQAEGYQITVNSEGIFFQAQDENGFWYAGQTLLQLVENGPDIPGFEIEDAPLLPNRAMHVDMRGWAPTKGYLEWLIRVLAGLKYNQLILDYAAHFQFNSQPGLSGKGALAPNLMAELEVYAREHGMMLIPMLHCIGNVDYLLSQEPYRELREDMRYPEQFCVSHPSTVEIFSAMAEDLMAVHAAPAFHIGGDGTRFLGACPACQARVKELGGRSALYLDHLGQVIRYLNKRGRTVLAWSDRLRSMSDEQLRWLPSQILILLRDFADLRRGDEPGLYGELERLGALGRQGWACVINSIPDLERVLEELDLGSEAAERRLASGMVLTSVTRDQMTGPLSPPPELGLPGVCYASERMWSGRKVSGREQILNRVGIRLFGLQGETAGAAAWGVYRRLFQGQCREARVQLREIYGQATRNQELLVFLDAWCRLGCFREYVVRFEEQVAVDYARLQQGTADPFLAGRLRWRIEDLKSRVADISKAFRVSAARFTTEAFIDECLNSQLAYGLQRLDDLGGLLQGYPLPDKEFEQPVQI